MDLTGFPAFARELHQMLPVYPQFALWGSLDDQYLIDEPGGEPRLLSLSELIEETLRRNGYRFVVWHDLLDPPRLTPGAAAAEAYHELVEIPFAPTEATVHLEQLRCELAMIARPRSRVRAAAVVDLANLLRGPEHLEPDQRAFFRHMHKLARDPGLVAAKCGRRSALHNPIVWLVRRESDLPDWFAGGNGPVRSLPLPSPDLGLRQRVAELLLTRDYDLARAQAAEPARRFAEQTDGMSLSALLDVTRLARDRGLGHDRLADAVRLYRNGVPDNPWLRGELRKRLTERGHRLAERVVGQRQAVQATFDLLKRAALGMTGAHVTDATSRPRGVLFFVGPTGVGKTELAKAIAEVVFGDATAYQRFDMSEFSAEHSAERLIGAPPGYVGHNAGGELTNAVRQQPFRVILFDEIEKAAPRILDKFLQILEDGRLTDGRGNTAFFADSVLVFTSNLGMHTSRAGRRVSTVDYGDDYPALETKLRTSVAEHFTRELGRPELLNRLKESIVVFDFIRPEAASAIFAQNLGNIIARFSSELGITLVVADDVRGELRDRCAGKVDELAAGGGRGIGAKLESFLTNPLSRALFDEAPPSGSAVEVTGLVDGTGGVELEVRVTRP